MRKYEPPPKLLPGDAERGYHLFPGYTNVENLRHYPTLFAPGELVLISEKIDGTNTRVGVVEGQYMAGSHHVRRKEPEDWSTSTYWKPLMIPGVRRMLDDLSLRHRQVVLFGETYGPGVRPNQYGQKEHCFAAFDLLLDGRYASADMFYDLCRLYVVPTAPYLGTVPYDLSTVRCLAEYPSALGGRREGVVVRPLTERNTPEVGRLILKFVSDSYMLDRKEDFTDV